MTDQKQQTKFDGGASVLTAMLGTMTDDNVRAWGTMGISKDWQIKRLTDWANMLERRLAQLDPTYRAYPFGRIVVDKSKPEEMTEEQKLCDELTKQAQELNMGY